MTKKPLDYNHDHEVEQEYKLEPIAEGYMPLGKPGKLIQKINERDREDSDVRVTELVTGQFLLRWDVPAELDGDSWETLSETKRHEIPLTSKQQAFALLVAVNLSESESFLPEIDALWG
jgi:hypothetical protein